MSLTVIARGDNILCIRNIHLLKMDIDYRLKEIIENTVISEGQVKVLKSKDAKEPY